MENIQLINTALPYIMHIDLNSCFAIIEQQANRLLRGRPVGIAAYDTPRGFVIAASYQAKAKGVKLGVNNAQAKALCPDIVILTPDPAKYREAHKLFKELLLEYTPDVVPKSIDEFVLNMQASPALRLRLSEGMSHNQAMLDIGKSMKQKIRERLGEYVTVNVGIGTNRFLAKYAAGFGKPDGMTLIDHANLVEKYTNMKLVDLPGINTRFRARLRLSGIYTPLDFLEADMNVLKKQVFKSINGYHWYRRLRGYEADAVVFSRKSIGHQYALPHKTTDIEQLERLLMKLCEKTGRRLRKNNYYATGIHLYLGFSSEQMTNYQVSNHNEYRKYNDQTSTEEPASFEHMHKFPRWSHGEKVYHRLYSTSDIYLAAKKLLHQAEIPNNVRIMSMHVFDLQPWDPEQLNLFQVQDYESRSMNYDKIKIDEEVKKTDSKKRVSDAVDAINNRYGEFVVTPATMMDMQREILDRIAFGQVNDL